MRSPHEAPALPSLPLEEWEKTKETLHRYCQVVGKVRMECSPYRNHWWHATLYVATRGLTTGPIPYGRKTFDVSLDLLENRLVVTTSEGGAFSFALDDIPIAEFYQRLFEGLRWLGMHVSINSKPFDLDDEHTLDTNTYHHTCDAAHVRRFHRVLAQVDQIFKEFAGRFSGKTSPVQLFWHSFDLAVTRFSDKRVSLPENTDPVTREAYSHEVISFGFWPGDRNVREPAFYSYTAPEPEGLTEQPLNPGAASWAPEGGTALLMYEEVRQSRDPEQALLKFLQSAYEAGAKTAGWDIEKLRAGGPQSWPQNPGKV